MHDLRWRCGPVALWVALQAGLMHGLPAAAQQMGAPSDTLTLTLGSAQELALQLSPSFAATTQGAAVARGEARSARQLPNPDFELEAPGASEGGLGAFQARVGQTIEWAGQRGLRIRAAQHGVAQAGAEVRDAARELVRDVSLLYLEAAVAAQRLELAERVAALNDRLVEAVRAQLAQGKVSPLDANLAEIEDGRARARLLAARRGLASALTGLKERIGLEAGRPVMVTLPEDLPETPVLIEDSLTQTALRQRPDVAARSSGVAAAASRLNLARREAIPSLTVGPMLERNEANASPTFGFAVGITVPLWNRNRGAVAQWTAESRRAAYELTATELAVRAEVREAREALIYAREEVELFRASVLDPAQENQRLLDIAYEAGKIDLPTFLLVRNQLLDAETEYWDAWLAREQAKTRLLSATGSLDMGDASFERRQP